MKQLRTLMLSLLLLGATLSSLMAQQAGEIRINIQKNVDGVETTIDTVITLAPGQDPATVLQELGLETDLPGSGTFAFDFDTERLGDSMKVIIRQSENDHTIQHAGEEDIRLEGGTGGVWIIEHGETRRLDEGADFRVFRFDGERLQGEDEMEVNVDVQEENGQKKVIVRRNGETQEILLDEDVEWQTEDRQVTVRRLGAGDSVREEHRIMMFQGEEISEEDKARLQEFMESGGSQEEVMTIVREFVGESGDSLSVHTETQVVRILIHLEDPEREEMNMLRDAGASDLNNSLRVKQLEFYPNPSNGQFTLAFQSREQGPLRIQVRDLQGRLVYEQRRNEFSGAYEEIIDISGESAGIYFLTVTINGKSTTKKIVME